MAFGFLVFHDIPDWILTGIALIIGASSLNFGAVGATICSAALAWGICYAQLPWLGAACSLAGLAVIMFAARRDTFVAIA